MKKLAKLVVSIIVLSSVTACADVSNQDVGVISGGAIGGLLGSQFGGGSGKILATVGGAVLGAFLGGSIGHSMDKVDQMRMNQALEGAPSDQVVTWHNPDTGNTYYVTPTRTYYQGPQPCRDFTTKAIIGGKTQTVYGHACRMADGTWQMQNN